MIETKKVLGVGIYTKEKYSFGKKGNPTKEYSAWLSMLTRCYNERFLKNNITYRGCSVCKEWMYFQNFAEWFNDNYIDGYQLDKDLLQKGNKIYGPDTCCFVLQEINLLVVNRKNNRGKYPIGVSKDKKNFAAGMNINGKRKHIGNFQTIEEAFFSYKEYKENYIKLLADKYKNKINNKVYSALVSFQINITD